MTSKTQQALQWLEQNPEATPYRAAKMFHIASSAIYAALNRPRCSHCGGYLPVPKVGTPPKPSAKNVKVREALKDLLE